MDILKSQELLSYYTSNNFDITNTMDISEFLHAVNNISELIENDKRIGSILKTFGALKDVKIPGLS